MLVTPGCVTFENVSVTGDALVAGLIGLTTGAPATVLARTRAKLCALAESEEKLKRLPAPAVIPSTLLRPVTSTGVKLLVVVPSPSWPNPLKPQAHAAPSSFRARL